jgi:hypothetical protein
MDIIRYDKYMSQIRQCQGPARKDLGKISGKKMQSGTIARSRENVYHVGNIGQ